MAALFGRAGSGIAVNAIWFRMLGVGWWMSNQLISCSLIVSSIVEEQHHDLSSASLSPASGCRRIVSRTIGLVGKHLAPAQVLDSDKACFDF
jgi:hypothetical protein